jgi:lysozyme family protein
MKLLGLLLAVVGWLIPLIGLGLTENTSTGARLTLCIVGIAISCVGIFYVLNQAHQKQAVWKR